MSDKEKFISRLIDILTVAREKEKDIKKFINKLLSYCEKEAGL